MEIINALRQFLAEFTVLVMTLIAPTPVPLPVPTVIESIATSTVATVIKAPSYQIPQTSTTTEKSAVIQAFELGKIVGKAEASLDIAQAKIETTTVTNTPIASQPTPEPTQVINQPTQITMTPTPTQIASAPVSQARIEIYPIQRNGLSKEYKASPEPTEKENFIVLGAIVYDVNGNVDRDAVVTITTSDATQDKVKNGTGDVITIYPNEEKLQVLGYKFNYDFKTPGDHTITFSANGLSKSVVINAK